MAKVAVVTLHYIRNYGSVLQTYATQKKFESMGYEVEVVDYVRPNALNLDKGEGNFIKKSCYELYKKLENSRRNKVCIEFLNKYVHMTKYYKDYEELKQAPPDADVYCTGSDQTWNSEYNGGVLPAYYLEFAPEGKKRIGYSVSIGMDEIPENEKKLTSQYVGKYDLITVREASAKKILEGLGCKNVEHVLDPTLVLNKSDWEHIIAPNVIKDKYIIIYRLNDNAEMEAFAKKLAQETGCKIVRMSYYLSHFKNSGKMIYSPKVEEFLSLINYAEYVVTDSFHCTAFSLNFHKKFFVFYPGKYSTRLQSILSLTGTEHRAIVDGNNMAHDIDYEYVDTVLNAERQKVTDLINQYCI